MAFRIQPATMEHDEGVTRLFTQNSVAINPAYWERAFSPDNPSGMNSRPFVAVDHDGEVLGFISSRPIELFIEGQYTPARVVHDFLVTDDPVQRDVAGLLLKDVQEGGEVTLVAGAGTAPSKLLEQNGFQRAGEFCRLHFDPKEKAAQQKGHPVPLLDMQQAESFPLAVDALAVALAAERRIFRRRNAEALNWQFRGPARETEVWISPGQSGCDAYAVLRRVNGRHGQELHLVDAACPNVEIKRLGLGLMEIARSARLPLYASFFARNWEVQLNELGFEPLRARWPLHWILRDPRQRVLGGALIRSDAWFFTPADGEIDQW